MDAVECSPEYELQEEFEVLLAHDSPDPRTTQVVSLLMFNEVQHFRDKRNTRNDPSSSRSDQLHGSDVCDQASNSGI